MTSSTASGLVSLLLLDDVGKLNVPSSSYFLKFSMKSLPSFSTSPLKSAVPFHDLAGLSSSSGTLGQVLGTDRPKVS